MRQEFIAQLESKRPWDMIVVGGGAVGAGIGLDAAARGYTCALFEQHDFAKGTSSRSTKLVHGGVRYLAQGNVALVREALHERGLLLQNAPSLVRPLRFLVPCHSSWERWYYWTGLKAYDALAGSLGIHPTVALNTRELAAAVPGLNTHGLKGGVAYFDAQFDDARMVIAILQEFQRRGGAPLNYFRVEELLQSRQRVVGVRVQDLETSQHYEVPAKVVVNAAGVFTDRVRQMESPAAPALIAPSQGIHFVVDQEFLGGNDAVMIPKTRDGRVLFAIPWLGRALLGTTDTPVQNASLEPRPLDVEVEYLLQHFSEYFQHPLHRSDVRSCFAGLRPLVRPQTEAGATSKISREHRVLTSKGGLVSILGGKWTTYRKMAEDVLASAEQVAGLPSRPCSTHTMRLTLEPGPTQAAPDAVPSDQQVRHLIADEFARTPEDVLARRFRCLLLDARRSIATVERVAVVMADELGKSDQWRASQINSYRKLCAAYILEKEFPDK